MVFFMEVVQRWEDTKLLAGVNAFAVESARANPIREFIVNDTDGKVDVEKDMNVRQAGGKDNVAVNKVNE